MFYVHSERRKKMNIVLLGAAGFIGTNLSIELLKSSKDSLTLVDKNISFFSQTVLDSIQREKIIISNMDKKTNWDDILNGQEVVYHLISTTVPTTSNMHIVQELEANVIVSANIFEACVRQGVKKIVFISSGGTVYGKTNSCPLSETYLTEPINSYGIQKLTIEKLLHLYYCMYNLDYRIVRLSNPYGPYQRPNGVLGVITTFTYNALKGRTLQVYGDGSVVRDFIYIEDAVRGILNIANGTSMYRLFNLGCGYGTSIKDVVNIIINTLDAKIGVQYTKARNVDVPINYLDISRYESCFGKLSPIGLSDGIKKTADFLLDRIDAGIY